MVDFAAALPDVTSAIRVRGLEAEVEILRDSYGIPHVRARGEHDAFFGQGFATAQDRLWQMDHDRLRAYGRSAEHLGSDAVATDIKMPRLQLAASVEADFDALDAETRAMLEAFTSGVNAFVETTATRPVEYELLDTSPEPWRPWDCIAVHKVRHNPQGVYEQKLWRSRLVRELGPERTARLYPGYRPGEPLIVPPDAVYEGPGLDGLAALAEGAEAVAAADLGGSNNLAIAGSRTRTGKPLVAGDPHRQLDVPNLYYQSHVACEAFDAIGLTFPGVPGFCNFGHNEHVAWSLTHGMADEQDVYIEQFDAEEPSRYRHGDEWRLAKVVHETIAVRGGAAVEIDVTVTEHGPVIAGDPASGYALALKHTATCEPNSTMAGVRTMLSVRTVDEMDEAMRDWVSPIQNLVSADVHGDIAFVLRGKIATRPETNAWLPVPAWDRRHEWNGYVPFEELPRVRNPDVGCIVTANNRIVGPEFPYHIALDYAPGFRARRILDRLAPMRAASVDDVADVVRDLVSLPALVYRELLREVEPADGLGTAARDAVVSWDGAMRVDGPAPSIYRTFRLHLDRRVIGHLIGPIARQTRDSGAWTTHAYRLSSYLVSLVVEGDTSLLPEGSDWRSLAAQAFASAVAELRERLGDDVASWRWGDMHATRPRHPLSAAYPDLASTLDPPAVPMPGDADTPMASACLSADPTVVTNLPAARYVFDPSDWDRSLWIVPFGSSGHPASPHYGDQHASWAALEYFPMLFSWEELTSDAETRQSLVPA